MIISNDNIDGMKAMLEEYNDRTSTINDVFYNSLKTITDVVLPVIRMIPILNRIEIMGKLQFVIWKRMPEDIIVNLEKTLTDTEIDDIVFEWQKDEVKNTIEQLLKNENIANKTLLRQCIDSYNQEEYNVAAIGFTAIIDQLLTDISKNESTKWTKRVEEIVKQANQSGIDTLSDENYMKVLLLTTYKLAQDSFGEFSKFGEPEPNTLNRHWIMHGRTSRVMSQKDCIKIINYVYGTILMGELIMQ